MTLLTWTSVSIALAAAAGAVLVQYLASTAHQWYRLRKVPGPWLAGVSYLWIVKTIASGDPGPFEDMGDKYGHLVRVGPNMLLTDLVDVLRRMSGTRSDYGKDAMYSASLKHTEFDNMFTTTNVAKHDELKAKLLGPYSGRETDKMEPIVDELVNDLIKYLRDKMAPAPAGPHGSSSSVVDLAKVSLYFTMDVITRLAFGQELGFLRTDSDVHSLLGQIRGALRIAFVPLVVPWMRDIVLSRPLIRFLRPQPTDKKGFGVALKIAEDAVTKRFAPGAPDRKDLLGACVRAGFSEGQIASEMFFALSAGSDTTGSVIRSTMLQLITSPQHYRKLKETVLRATREGSVSLPIKQEEAKKLPYLQAVIYEGLRMRPAAPILFNKTVPPQGDVIDGIFVPGGTAIGQNLFPLLRAREHWGDDAALFRPERFLEADGTRRASMERLVEMVFGYGRFGCAGKPLAFMELNKVFFEFFRNFEFRIVNPAKPWDSVFYSVFVESNFMVHITEAQSSTWDS